MQSLNGTNLSLILSQASTKIRLKLLSEPLLEGSRRPNTAPFSFGNDSFKVVQYNGRGILLSDPCARQLAVKNIQALAKTAHVLCLEEVHEHHLEIESCFGVWIRAGLFCFFGF